MKEIILTTLTAEVLTEAIAQMPDHDGVFTSHVVRGILEDLGVDLPVTVTDVGSFDAIVFKLGGENVGIIDGIAPSE